jgi:NAD(P)-dependent dehydrogenase (short-subunit alcohol dehydrogenase family)
MGVTGRFVGKTVFVTGGAHGIGLAAARAFASERASVFLFDRASQLLPEASAEVERCGGGLVGTYAGDVRARTDVEDAVAICERQLGPVDILLNNAGYARSRHTLDIEEAGFDEVIGVSLTGIFRVAQTVARTMVSGTGGVILNACASSAVASEPGLASYAAAKAGVLALTRVMAVELAPHHIRVCSVLPGEIKTYAWPNVELGRIYEGRIAAARSGRPEEAAAAYLFLASEDASHLTGAAFIVDGGMLAWE